MIKKKTAVVRLSQYFKQVTDRTGQQFLKMLLHVFNMTVFATIAYSVKVCKYNNKNVLKVLKVKVIVSVKFFCSL